MSFIKDGSEADVFGIYSLILLVLYKISALEEKLIK